MANYNKLTESKYKAIKIMLKGGATVKEVEEYLQISNPTIYAVRKSENYEEYIQISAERHLTSRQAAAIKSKTKEQPKEEPKEVVKEVRQTVTIQATHYMMQELQKSNELLTLISKKLAFIVDELCGTKGGNE